jgi:hypothetical protein
MSRASTRRGIDFVSASYRLDLLGWQSLRGRDRYAQSVHDCYFRAAFFGVVRSSSIKREVY